MTANSPFVERHRIEPTASGLLDGLSFAVKDLLAISGKVAGSGNPTWAETAQPAEKHATAVAQWLQAKGQARVGAQDAAVIYALDPVWGAVFAAVLLGETLGQQGFLGAGLILAAALMSIIFGISGRMQEASIEAPDAQVELSKT